ncbi:MAG: sugar transporter permease, partial [Paenibacillus sp.]|nr:sugar transporter permease [Paenibacillus sp.]
MSAYRGRAAGLLRSSVIHIILISGALIMVGPFLWMVLTSLKTFGEATQVPPVILPAVPQWHNYADVMNTLPFVTFYMNTLITTAAKTIGQLLLCSMAAYAFARIEFPGRHVLF